MALSDTAIRNAKPKEGLKVTRLSDGGGLYVQVERSGAKLWRLAYRFDGKQKKLSLGAYPAVSLAQARAKRDEAKTLLANGVDPFQQKKVAKAAQQAVAHTFSVMAGQFIDKLRKEKRSASTLGKIEWMLTLASGLNDKPIAKITAADILDVLKKVEAAGKHETASRLRETIGRVFRFAVASCLKAA
ncbi:hypothetical protein M2323_001850 [Rhodoblastus acidophilus]|uniref:tyrosine-type recombinase/integrase n=1 Tax=Rhodoblastus acidophilus TaxID=1074 RepID=UPI0022251D27|nr:integrase arm-type DNA-binding domain-containing protein [Rhodoblastus acidophilus]MCW2283718.1 hypothetical protein [Rhodoblastus acidophilus]MCW2332933.1 hypothetical protein [Rhodoblastus acidophilus]